MRKAINFDINTKEYEKITGKKASNAYDPIKRFLLKRNFIHRQGSFKFVILIKKYENIKNIMQVRENLARFLCLINTKE